MYRWIAIAALVALGFLVGPAKAEVVAANQPVASLSVNVLEPASVVLASIGALLIVGGRRRRRPT